MLKISVECMHWEQGLEEKDLLRLHLYQFSLWNYTEIAVVRSNYTEIIRKLYCSRRNTSSSFLYGF